MSKKRFAEINTTTVALAVSCIIMLIAVIVAVAYWEEMNTNYTILQSQTSDYVDNHSHTNSDYDNLKSQYLDDENELSTANNQSTVSQLQDQINSAESQVANDNNRLNALNLANVEYLVPSNTTFNQNAGGYSSYSYTLNCSGIIRVTIFTPSDMSPNVSIEVNWNYIGSATYQLNYNQTITPTDSEWNNANFPVIASTSSQVNVQIIVTNGSPIEVSGTISISYDW